ncbi:MAG: phosphotransferase [Micavibrio sp.]
MLSLNAQDYFEGRKDLRLAFLQTYLGNDCTVLPLAADWASRRYFRVRAAGGGKSRVLMEAVPDHTGAYTPGHKIADFLRIARALKAHGIHAPSIIAADEGEGYVLLEDFGDLSAYDALEQAASGRGVSSAQDIYAQAVDILIALRGTVDADALSLPDYYSSHVHKGRRRIVDWYIPAVRRAKNQDGLVESYLAAWDEVERALPPCPQGMVHGDYHMQNLMILPGTLGVLDFQGAMRGPLPYDLANLLEDIRRDVPDDIHAAMLERYGGGEDFRAWFRVMATQFHCRILGQILRLAVAGGRTDMLGFIPRVQAYLKRGLSDPALAPLARWMEAEKVDLDAAGCFAPEEMKYFIRGDAF